MAKQRFINTKFWSDSFIRKLKPAEKLLFLYFLTNEHTEICGVYELPLDIIAFETGYPMDTISKGIDTLSKAGKIFFFGDWVYLKNFRKHQTSSPKVKQGIEISFSKVPEEIRLKIAEVDTLSIPYRYPIDTISHSNSDPNSDPNSERGEINSPTPSEQAKDFFLSYSEKDERWLAFLGRLNEKYSHVTNLSTELDKFVNYWTEKTLSGNKERWQTEKTFEVQKRIATWLTNSRSFSVKQGAPKTVTII